MALKAKISEIFQSVQGEGKYPGVKQVFVRFFGCPLNCVWCDTGYARKVPEGQYREMAADEILDQVTRLWDHDHSVSLTGGEPLLQKDFLKSFIPRLKQAGMSVYLDTNGTDHAALRELSDSIDFIAMDIKLPSSAQCPPLWKEHEQFLRVAAARDVFVKTVITADTFQEDMLQAAAIVAGVDPGITMILQPESGRSLKEALARCVEFQSICLKSLHDVRIMPQLHKLTGLR